MAKVLLVYWSGTGNTRKMADAVAEGARGAGADVTVKTVDAASPDELADYDAVALGCPAMGAEVLEETEMEPFVESLSGAVSGKRVGLFGSYDWGDGEWMRLWADRMRGYGAALVDDGLILQLEPDAEGEENCKNWGKQLA